MRLDQELPGFGLRTADDLLQRKGRLAAVSPRAAVWPNLIRQVLVLSRVTLGADIAVTGTLIAHLKSRFPRARIVLLGPEPIRELFAGDARVDVRTVEYARNGGLLDAAQRLAGRAGRGPRPNRRPECERVPDRRPRLPADPAGHLSR